MAEDALESMLGGSRDRVTRILTSDVPDFREIAVGIANAMTGHGSYGDTINKMKAQRISEELGLAKTMMQFAREQRAEGREERLLKASEATATRQKYMAVGKGVFNIETGNWQIEPSRADKENLIAVNKGLWDIPGNKWIVEPPKEKPASTNFKNVIFPGGEVKMIDENDAAAMQEANSKGGRIVGMQMTGTPGDFAPDKVTGRNLQQSIADSEANIAEVKLVEEGLSTPAGKWSTGVRDWFTKNVAGFAQQAGVSDKAGIVTGPRIEDVQAVRTSLRSLLGRFVRQVSGDRSGRYSDKDMALANEAAVVAQDATAPVESVMSSLRQMRAIETRALLRDRVHFAGKDIRSEEGIAEYAKAFKRMFPDMNDKDAAAQIIKDLGLGGTR